MILVVDTDRRACAVVEAHDCRRLGARVAGGGGLAPAPVGVGTEDPDGAHLWILVDRLRELAIEAGASSDARWSGQFDAMLRYAAGKGWLDASGRSVRVHVER